MCKPGSKMTCNPPIPAVVDCPADLAIGASIEIVQDVEDGPCVVDGTEAPIACPPPGGGG